jgi:glyoxylase-like metal-dependent hydrolase (beta-lactamase superfamily II)
MYELIRVTDTAYYINCPAKVGIVKINDSEVCLIDSGNDKDAAKKILKITDEAGWKIKAIYNTHSHADHIGGNHLIKERTGCSIFASGIECDFTNHTVLEPAFLYGAFPPSALLHKFLFAKESEALPLCDDVLPENLKIIPLSGHSFDMVGFKTNDGAVFIADSVSSMETLDKYGVTFIYDVEEELKTLNALKSMDAVTFIPSHADACESISSLAEYNEKTILSIKEKILSFCEEPSSEESILKNVFDSYSLKMTFEEHALVGSSVRSYLSYLYNKGLIIPKFENNTLLWEKKYE